MTLFAITTRANEDSAERAVILQADDAATAARLFVQYYCDPGKTTDTRLSVREVRSHVFRFTVKTQTSLAVEEEESPK